MTGPIGFLYNGTDHAGPKARRTLCSLRSAARLAQERFLVGLADEGERARAWSSSPFRRGPGGGVAFCRAGRSTAGRRTVRLAVLDEEGVDAERTPSPPRASLRPLADVVLLLRGDPERCSDFYAREVAALLPRPLPGSDALVRAHLRWLASCGGHARANCCWGTPSTPTATHWRRTSRHSPAR